MIVERFAVAHDHERTTGRSVCRLQELRSLDNRRRHRGAGEADDVGIEVVEEELNRPVVGRQRSEDVALAGKSDQRVPVTWRGGAIPANLLSHPLEATGPFILGHHGQRRIERERYVEATLSNNRCAGPPARPGETDECQGERRSKPNRPRDRWLARTDRGKARDRRLAA